MMVRMITSLSVSFTFIIKLVNCTCVLKKIQLGFKDVLIRPKRSTSSKAVPDVELERQFTFKTPTGQTSSGVPIIVQYGYRWDV